MTGTTSIRLAGVIGLCLTGALLSVSSWRLIFHSWGCMGRCRRNDGGDLPRVVGITMRRAFHGLLWVAMFCQVLAYSDLAFGSAKHGFFSDRLGLALLNIVGRGIFEYAAFSVVTIVWFHSTARARAGASETKRVFCFFPSLLVIAGVVLVLHSMGVAVDLFSGGDIYADVQYYAEHSSVYHVHLLVEAFAWSLHGVLIVICQGMMYKRLRHLTGWKRLRRRKQRCWILVRMYASMTVCALCYLLRAAFFVVDYVSLTTTRAGGAFESWIVFWVASIWIPSIVPSVVLLYTLRRRDRTPGYIEGVPDSSSIPRPAVPPEEVFNAFRRSIYDEEAENSPLEDSFEEMLLPSSGAMEGEGEFYFDYESSEESLIFS